MYIHMKKYKPLNKRVYGLIGVSAIQSNFNADFSGQVRRTASERIMATDVCLKYPYRHFWDMLGEQVFTFKRNIFKGDKLTAKDCTENFESLFGLKLGKSCSQRTVIEKLFTTIDSRQFGFTFPVTNYNLSAVGPVQFSQGYNIFEDAVPDCIDNLAPYRNSKKETTTNDETDLNSVKGAASLGNTYICEEAHYMYHFSIDQFANKKLYDAGIESAVYTQEDYDAFKDMSLQAVTAYNSRSKAGCSNELAVFIECKPLTTMKELNQLITFTKGYDGDLNTFEFQFLDLLNGKKDSILSVEVYYDTTTTHKPVCIEGTKYFDINTKAEIV